MGFLDNLESSLKSLEGNQERETGAQDRQRRQDERSQALKVAPNAEALKKSSFTSELLMHAVRIGHGLRVKVNMVWVGTTLRLDARDFRLELQPTADGIQAVMSRSGEELSHHAIDLQATNPDELAREWLAPLAASLG